ncbi:ABC transporter permease [Thermomonospora umbrina]|uniref:Peptide/nickel transport system permease protein n=1 Tax=Thermomonospora umbrina TaxID=111806 RepID=A0A3D9SXJ6_9ACTN|nr:ABC transporter permease [Thermomonospora umbrina]REE98773.1 peptide/nickel transport system permease protein [Thermomonospora umbrina]
MSATSSTLKGARTGGTAGAARLRGLLTGGHPMLGVIGRRLLTAIPLLLGVSLLSFALTTLAPGDAARSILGPNAAPESYEQLRHAMGLDLPLWEQYWRWLTDALRGDLGASAFNGQAVTDAIGQRFPVTASLMAGSLLVSVLAGVSLGVVSALRGGLMGRAIDTLALVGFALPAFWLGAELIVVFSVWLGWFPSTGYVPFAESPGEWLRSLVLPVAALSLYGLAGIAKQTREAMLDVLGSEYIRVARANGLGEWSLVMRHALKNASSRVVTVLGVLAVSMLGGTILVESVFALPGLGSLVVGGAVQHDLPMVQGVALFFTAIVVVINLTIDLAYTWLDPKVRVR